MSPIAPALDVAFCRGPRCGARIIFADTMRGKKMPLDADPEKRAVFYEQPTLEDPEHRAVAIVDAYIPHHATCKDVEQMRRAG